MKLLRNYAIVLIAVLLLGAGLGALCFRGNLTRADQAVVNPRDPMKGDLTEEGHEDLLQILELALNRGTKTDRTVESPKMEVILQTRSRGGVPVKAYSLTVESMIDRNALLEDLATGEKYRLSVMDVTRLFSHKALTEAVDGLFEPPALKIEIPGQYSLVSPAGYDVKIFRGNGDLRETRRDTAQDNTTVTLTEEQATQMKITSGAAPDGWSLTAARDGETAYTQSRSEALTLPAEAGEYLCTATAHYGLSTEKDWYGDIIYVFRLRITAPGPAPELPTDPAGEAAGT